MKIGRRDLDWAAERGLIAPDQAEPLWRALEARAAEAGHAETRFDLPNVAYYLGAVLVIVAMFLFMTLAWREYGGFSLVALAVVYGAGFFVAGRRFWARPETRIAGGLLLALAVFMVPLAVFGIEIMLGLWAGDVRSSAPGPTVNRMVVAAAAIAASLAMIGIARFSFLAVPLMAASWLIVMDAVNLATWPEVNRGNLHEAVSMIYGAVAIVLARAVDRRWQEDFAFWGYLGGLMAFWFGFAGMTLFEFDSAHLANAVFAFVGVLCIGAAVVLSRPVFVIFGSLAVLGWLMDLAYGIFEDSLAFPLVLSAIGIFVLWLGLRYHKHRVRIEGWLRARLPASLRALAPDAPPD